MLGHSNSNILQTADAYMHADERATAVWMDRFEKTLATVAPEERPPVNERRERRTTIDTTARRAVRAPSGRSPPVYCPGPRGSGRGCVSRARAHLFQGQPERQLNLGDRAPERFRNASSPSVMVWSEDWHRRGESGSPWWAGAYGEQLLPSAFLRWRRSVECG